MTVDWQTRSRLGTCQHRWLKQLKTQETYRCRECRKLFTFTFNGQRLEEVKHEAPADRVTLLASRGNRSRRDDWMYSTKEKIAAARRRKAQEKDNSKDDSNGPVSDRDGE